MDIWVIGDINYLTSVLNALAMLSNSGLFIDLIKVGLALGVLFFFVEYLNRYVAGGGGGLPWGRFVLIFMIYGFAFGGTTTVHLNDTYSLKSQDVDNVPYGVAFAGSFMSKAAHEITLALEQAFTLPHMTEFGFGTPLLTLTKGQAFFGGIETLHNGKIAKTLVEYCDKCTSAGLNKGELDLSAIKTAASPWSAMKWTSDIYYAMTWLPSDPPQGTLRSCTEAWGTIDNYLSGQLWADWNKFLSSQICAEGAETCDPIMTMQTALDSLADQQQDARNYMMAAVLLPAFEQGQIQFDSFMGKPEMAVIVGQAREQRNIQWQAEGSLFMNIARPMMAFFEGFLYALAPFMALLLGLGQFGLMGKYFMMFVWVQMWMPVMAILNHYTQIIAQHKLSALISSDIPLTSIQGHLIAASSLNDWMGVAGVLVASTPAISLALLYGGAITMTHLAGRLQHGDFVNEKIARPDVVQPAPLLSMNTAAPYDSVQGLRGGGADAIMPKLEASEFASQALQSSKAKMVTDQRTVVEAWSQLGSHGTMAGYGLSQLAQSTVGTEAHSGLGFGSISAAARMVGKDLNWQQSDVDRLAGNFSAGAGVMGTGANVTAGFDSTKAQQLSDYMKTHFDLSGNKTLKASIDEKMSSLAITGALNERKDLFRQEDSSNTQKATQKMEQAKKEFSETSQFASRVGMSQSIPFTAYGRAGADGKMGMSFGEFMQRNQLWLPPGRVADEAAKFHDPRFYGIADKGQANWMGAAKVMQKLSKYRGDDPGEKAKAQMARETLLGTMDKAGFLAPETGDPMKFEGQVDTAKLEAGADHAAQAAAGLSGPGDVAGQIQGIKGGIPGVKSPGDVQRFYDGEAAGIRTQQGEQMMDGAREQYAQTIDDTIREFGQKESWSQKFLQTSMGALQAAPSISERLFTNDMSAETAVTQTNWDKQWEEAKPKLFDAHFREAKKLGLDDSLSKVFAGGAMNGWAMAAKERLGVNSPLTDQYAKEHAQAVQARTTYNQERGYAPDAARELAEKEIFLVERGGQTGMKNWVEKINSGDKIFSQAREANFHMSSAPRGGGYSGSHEHFVAGVHGAAAKAEHIKGTSLEGLHPEMMVRLKAMSVEYHQMTGKDIKVADAFRTYEQQVALKQQKPDHAATPGKSNHGYGLAVDINQNTANDLAQRGLLAKHGLMRPMMNRAPGHKYEPWHIELGGIWGQAAKQRKGPKIM